MDTRRNLSCVDSTVAPSTSAASIEDHVVLVLPTPMDPADCSFEVAVSIS